MHRVIDNMRLILCGLAKNLLLFLCCRSFAHWPISASKWLAVGTPGSRMWSIYLVMATTLVTWPIPIFHGSKLGPRQLGQLSAPKKWTVGPSPGPNLHKTKVDEGISRKGLITGHFLRTFLLGCYCYIIFSQWVNIQMVGLSQKPVAVGQVLRWCTLLQINAPTRIHMDYLDRGIESTLYHKYDCSDSRVWANQLYLSRNLILRACIHIF